MHWAGFILPVLLGALIGWVMSIAAKFWVESRRRCRACGRARVLRRVRGTRRNGFVRFRCAHCGTKQWGVIEPRESRFVLR